MIAIDTETHLIPSEDKIRVAHAVPDMVCYTWASDEPRGEATSGLGMWDADQGSFLELLEEAAERGETLVFHNAKFDLAVLSKWFPDCRELLECAVGEGRVLDTRVLYALRYPLKDRPRSLAAVVQHLFRRRVDKGAVRTSFRRGQTLTEQQRQYAIDDTYWTLMVAKRLLEIPLGGLARPEPEHEFVIEAQPLYNGPPPDVLYSQAAAYLAWYLEPEGLKVNRPEVEARYRELSEEEDRLSLELYEAGLVRAVREKGAPVRQDRTEQVGNSPWRVAWRSPLRLTRVRGSRARGYTLEETAGRWQLDTAELRRRFVEAAKALGFEPPVTPSGTVSMEYDFWKEYKADLEEPLQRYLELTKVRKYRSAFVGPLYDQNPAKVYPHYLIPGAETGRWACFKPNIQQQPKKLRPMYGGRMVGADYKSLECYTLAHAMASLGIRGAMLEALEKEDLHSFVAQQCGVSRQEAKIATFGLGGGMGFNRFYKYMRYQCGLNVTYSQACEVRMKWLMFFRDVSAYLELFQLNHYSLCPTWCSKETWLRDLGFDLDEGWPSNFELSQKLGGRITCVLPSGRVVPRRTYSQAANLFFQGTGADVMTLAFVRMCQNRLSPLAVVHDSAYVSDSDQSPAMAREMASALASVCPTLGTVPVPEPEERATFF